MILARHHIGVEGCDAQILILLGVEIRRGGAGRKHFDDEYWSRCPQTVIWLIVGFNDDIGIAAGLAGRDAAIKQHTPFGLIELRQELLGDLVFIELPPVGKDFVAGKECAVVESVKAASDVYAPIAGKVLEVNSKLSDAPETLNKDAYSDGWMFRLQPANKADIDKLLDAKAYEAMVAAESH